jgi:hypothetical protein
MTDARSTNSVTPCSPSSGVNATAVDAPAPISAAAVATLSDPTSPPPQATSEASVNCGEASVSSLSSSRIPGDWDRQAVAEDSTPDLSLSAAVDGIFMNSRTFATSAINESISQSSE